MARRIIGWDEQDVHTPWRKLYCWTQRAGATSKVKRRTRRRERREGDEEVRAYVSRLWAEDWDSPEDAVYDSDRSIPNAAATSSSE